MLSAGSRVAHLRRPVVLRAAGAHSHSIGRDDVKTLLVSIVATLGFIVTCATHAQVPATAPAGTTGQCKDGTWYSGASKKGACHGHQGVKEWYGAADTSTSSTSTSGSSTKSTSKTTSSTAAATSSSSKDTHAASSASTTTSASTGTPPAGATGLCNDGTYYSGESKRGACHGHKGVKTWYGADTSKTTATPPSSTSPSATPAPATMPAQTFPKSTPATMPNAQTPTTGTQTGARPTLPGGTSATPAAGGGAGKVWVNTSSKVYHCQGDRYYGTTKEGGYMSEADAIAKGNRAAHGKACSS
jgi:hypothetical protein